MKSITSFIKKNLNDNKLKFFLTLVLFVLGASLLIKGLYVYINEDLLINNYSNHFIKDGFSLESSKEFAQKEYRFALYVPFFVGLLLVLSSIFFCTKMKGVVPKEDLQTHA